MSTALWLMVGAWAFILLWVPMVIATNKKTHPRALFTLFFAEMWERFSFYGMRALLIFFMTKQLFDQIAQGEADARAYGIYGAYNALLYATPIIGGMLADRVMGFRRAIMLGGILMAAGQFTLAATAGMDLGESLFFIGLGLLTIGNGFFKPNISSFLGTFYDQNDKRKDSAFTIFYMGINIGAFLAPITIGYLGETHGWHWGFLVAGIGMLVGMIWFVADKKTFEGKGLPVDPDYHKPYLAGLSKEWIIILGSILAIFPTMWLINAEAVTSWILWVAGIVCIGYLIYGALTAENKEEGQRMIVFVFLFFFHMIFWMLFEQAGGSLNILADRYVDLGGLKASQLQSVNPFYIIILAPVFSWIWSKLSKAGKEPRTPVKFFLGLLQMALGYFVIVWGIRSVIGTADSGTLIPLFFLLGMYLFHTTGELSLSPVGLSVVTKLSPGKVVGFVMGCWFLSIALAHKIAGKLGQIIAGDGGADGKELLPAEALTAYADVYMTWGVYVVLGAAAILLLLTPILKKWMHGVH